VGGGERGGRGDPLDRGAERPGDVNLGPFGLRRKHAVMTPKTIEAHQLRICRKVGVRSRAKLARRLAIQSGLGRCRS
jgi:hypothetical protein